MPPATQHRIEAPAFTIFHLAFPQSASRQVDESRSLTPQDVGVLGGRTKPLRAAPRPRRNNAADNLPSLADNRPSQRSPEQAAANRRIRRIDRSHSAELMGPPPDEVFSQDAPPMDARTRDGGSRDEVSGKPPAGDGGPGPDRQARREQWLRLHASDLIDRLQAWSLDLDAREAQLDARLAAQRHSEHRARMQR